jgi:hypothetical protein
MERLDLALSMFITLTLCQISFLTAQEAADDFPHWYAGFTAGYTNTTLDTSGGGKRAFSQYERGHGFEIAIPGQYRFTEWFALRAELQFIQKNYTQDRDGNFEGSYMDVTNSFLDFPLMAQFSFGGSKLRGFLNAGGYIGVWLNSRRKGKLFESTFDVWNPDDTYYYEYDEKVEFDRTRDNRLDAGLLLGIGVQYEWKPVTFFIEGRYHYGLTDLQKDYMYGQIPRINDTAAVTLGVLFNHNLFKVFRKGN